MVQNAVKVVCLVGSSRFKAKFCEVGERLEKRGVLVLAMAFWQHADGHSITPEEREVLFRVDRARIDLAHEVWVVNNCRWWCRWCKEWRDKTYYQRAAGMGWHACPRFGCKDPRLEGRPYVGEDTLRELNYAANAGKVLRWLNPPEPGALPFDWSECSNGGTAMDKQEQKNAALRKQYVNHTPSDKSRLQIEHLRTAADQFHSAIEATAPSCRERSLALTKLEESLMWAVKGIVLNDPNATPAQPVDPVQQAAQEGFKQG